MPKLIVWSVLFPGLLFLISVIPGISQQPPHLPSESSASIQSLHKQARILYDRGRYAEALPLAEKAVLFQQAQTSVNDIALATTLNTLGLIQYELASLADARRTHERALEIRTAVLGPNHNDVAESLTNLARVISSLGDYDHARQLLEQAKEIRETILGANHPDLGVTLMHLAMVRGLQMDLDEALKLQARAVRIFDQAEAVKPVDHAMALNSYGTILGRSGSFSRAQTYMDRARDIQQERLGPLHPHLARTLDSLADLIAKMGNPEQAQGLAEQALEIRRRTLGQDHVEFASSLNTLGRINFMNHALQEAERHFREAPRIVARAMGTEHPIYAAHLVSLGDCLEQIGKLDEAQQVFSQALEVQRRVLGPIHPDVATSLVALSRVSARQHDYETAVANVAEAIQIREQSLGNKHPDYGYSLGLLAYYYHATGRADKARFYYKQARLVYLAASHVNQDLDSVSQAELRQTGLGILGSYAQLLGHIAQRPELDTNPPSALDDYFVVTEQARGWSVQSALAKAVARRKADTRDQATLVEAIEDLRHRYQSLLARMRKDSSQTQQLSSEIRQVQQLLDEVNEELKLKFSAYSELAFPYPIELRTVQARIRPHQALLSFLVLDDRLQILMVRAGWERRYFEYTIQRRKLEQLVQDLRNSLEQSRAPDGILTYDLSSATKLYEILFGHVRQYLDGVSDLILIPDAVLLPLPFAALITEDQSEAYKRLSKRGFGKHRNRNEFADYAAIQWLAKTYAVTVLPSASALSPPVHELDVPDNKSEPFIGIGDPVLQGRGTMRGGRMVATRGEEGSSEDVKQLPPLPGTGRELKAIADALGVPEKDHVYVRQDATERQVRDLHNAGRLGHTRILAFATHALLAREPSFIGQPALVLTPPQQPSELDDGLLTLEEILRLKLDKAEWVVLSACNTAGADGSGENLSGLARAFFFAGARALLVSQWSVDDHATEVLSGEIFKRYGGDQTSTRAETLRSGMIHLLEETSKEPEHEYFAHPYAWAPFTLVGDGGH
jgi:CHAT domain-containing protein/Tfp pilus assembly protein PilF